ncbi:hypothetical protein ACLBVR_30520, partial [Pseudomonas aeruginosa]|uniref:hypothetical protein n=1 Tax=Pseudomonas aeruginosa TaxID=287 RepID=UPI0039692236
ATGGHVAPATLVESLPPRASDGGKPWSKGQQNKATAFAKGKKKSRQPNIPR